MTAAPIAVALGLALAAGCRKPPPLPPPAKPEPTIRDTGSVGSRAFLRMKELTGNWLAGELPVTFEVIERGNAILQRGGLFAVWHADGNTLAAWVIAHTGYHVRMRSTAITEGPSGELVVELGMIDSGNVVPDEPIARALTMTIAPKNDGVTQRWSFGESLDVPPNELVMTRTDTGAPPPSTRQPPPPTSGEPPPSSEPPPPAPPQPPPGG